MKPQSNCYDCQKRKPGCHSACDTYKQWKENLYKKKPRPSYDAKNLEFDVMDRINARRRRMNG